MWLIIFIVWLALAGWLSNKIFTKIFHGVWTNLALAVFLPVFFLGTTANIFTAWLKLTDKSIFFSLAAILIILAIFAHYFSRQPELEKAEPEPPSKKKFPLWLWPVFVALILAGAYGIWISGFAGHLSSPWQVLPLWYLFVAGLAAAIIFYAIFAGEEHKRILAGIVLLSLLVHGYLLVYQNGFGGDRFRHLASEQRIIGGLEYQPTLQTENIWLVQIGPISAPQALFDRAKLSYGAQWSLEVIASKITGWPVFQINRLLLPLLWSILLPLLVYLGARLIDPDPGRRFALLAAQSASCLYLLQYYGSQGLPASYGLLWLAFVLVLILVYLKRGRRPLLWLIIVSLASLYFNYFLCFVLALIFFVLALIMKTKPRLAYVAAVTAVALLMIADYFSASTFALSWRAPFLAIIGGNLIYFNLFSHNLGQWHLIIDLAFIAVVVALLIWAARSAVESDDKSWRFVCWIFLVPLVAFIFSNSLFAGEHSLARRLTLFVCLPLIFILARLLGNWSAKLKPATTALVLGALFMLVYVSGPVLDVSVSSVDLARARELWPAAAADPQACVQEPIGVILALEYVSAKQFQETINDINCNK